MPVTSHTLTTAPVLPRRSDRVDERPDERRTPREPAPAPREHVVKRGESLSSIAEDHQTTVASLLELNPALRRDPDFLRVGQRVRLPEPERVRADDATVRASRGRAAASEGLSRARIGAPDQLRIGMSGPEVSALQQNLNAAGAARPALEVDGDFGPRTEAAAKRYQTSRGLAPSGVVDAATKSALAERRAPVARELEVGAFGPEVRTLQQQLNARGAHLTVDGDFGSATERAVRAFQRANRIEPDGVVGADTRALLESDRAARIPADAEPSARTVTGYRNGRAFALELVSIGNGEALSRPAAEAFLDMKAAAARDGVHLNVVSSFRSNEEQRALYRAYQRGQGNLAAPPGYSNHQGGIAVDITTGGSRQSASYRWLAANGARFGFVNTVPSEPWHWEYRR